MNENQEIKWQYQLVVWLENLQKTGMKHLSGIHLSGALSTNPTTSPAAIPVTSPAASQKNDPARVAIKQSLSEGAINVNSSPSLVSKPQFATMAEDNLLLDTGEITQVANKAQTIEELHTAFATCTRCRLAQGRNQLVFGVGNLKPRIVFIGEGPGAEEDQKGEPFVGPAGRLLSELIYAMGLTREDVYITNVVKCRPPLNRNPADDEVATCLPILKRQLQLLNPQLIISLGAVAFKALFPGAEGISRARGQFTKFQQWDLLPTYHPSYLLRKPSALNDCWHDFQLAFQRVYNKLGMPVENKSEG